MRTYRWLVSKPGRDPDLVLPSLTTTACQLVVRDETTKMYSVFEPGEFWDHLDKLPRTSRTFHEVVFGGWKQKIKFDLDMKAEELGGDGIPEMTRRAHAVVERVVDLVVDTFCERFYPTCGATITRDNVIVCDSSGLKSPDEYKFSFHVIVLDYCLENNRDARNFTRDVLERCPDDIVKFIDSQVNKSTQNFRIVGNSKLDGRVKEVALGFGCRTDAARNDTLISWTVGTRLLPTSRACDSADVTPALPEDMDRGVVEYVGSLGLDVGHAFREARGGMIFYDRTFPSYCRICSEVHHHDNTLMVLASRDQAAPGHLRLTEMCRHKPSSSLTIGYISVEGDFGAVPVSCPNVARPVLSGDPRSPGNLRRESSEEEDPFGRPCSGENTQDFKHVYSQPTMLPFEHVPTLVVKSQMGLGKTKALRKYIDTYFPQSDSKKYVVRFVTFRRAFSRSIKEQFPDFSSYVSIRGPIMHDDVDRLIIQVESLYRLVILQGAEPVDLLVLDEVESVLAQFSSGLHKNLTASFAMFQWMVTHSKHVVCMDANVGRRTQRMLADLRPAGPGAATPFLFHWNRFGKARDDHYSFTSNEDDWLSALADEVRSGKRIVVPTNSLKMAKDVEATLREKYPEKRIQLYSSETDQVVRNDHFENVDRKWVQFDVVIYTPTVSAGISFEADHFDILYGSFTSLSCNVETCRQMLGRVRSIRSRRYVIHLFGRQNNLPTTTEEIRKIAIMRQKLMLIDVVLPQMEFTYAPDGSIKYHDSPYFNMWIETVRLEHLSSNDFVRRFIDQVARTGASVEDLVVPTTVPYCSRTRSCDDHKVAEADDITEEEYLRFEDLGTESFSLGIHRKTIQCQDPRNAGPSHYAVEKYRIRQTYDWMDRPLSLAFVEFYRPRNIRRIYKNLIRICSGPSVVESLRLIQIREVDLHRRFESDSRILSSRFVYQQHFYCVSFLLICGFRCIMDPGKVYKEVMADRIIAAREFLADHVRNVASEYEIKTPSQDAIRGLIDPVKFFRMIIQMFNSVLRKMYGIAIEKCKKNDDYAISREKIGRLFDIVEEVGAARHDKPVVVSALKKIDTRSDDIVNFLLRRLYTAD